MKVFIDTNVLLNMYHLSGPDLAELEKLLGFVKGGSIDVIISKQVEEEFWRNRENVIYDALRQFKETRLIGSG